MESSLKSRLFLLNLDGLIRVFHVLLQHYYNFLGSLIKFTPKLWLLLRWILTCLHFRLLLLRWLDRIHWRFYMFLTCLFHRSHSFLAQRRQTLRVNLWRHISRDSGLAYFGKWLIVLFASAIFLHHPERSIWSLNLIDRNIRLHLRINQFGILIACLLLDFQIFHLLGRRPFCLHSWLTIYWDPLWSTILMDNSLNLGRLSLLAQPLILCLLRMLLLFGLSLVNWLVRYNSLQFFINYSEFLILLL
jgi:hypothetical protein